MGRCHALAFRMAPGVFDLDADVNLEILAERDQETAEAAAKSLGFSRATGHWRELVSDPSVDLVDITAPNALHKPIAFAAIEAGKPVYCEKPLAPNLADACQLAEAARNAGVSTFVGLNYLRDPVVALAREMITAGELGEVRSFRGIHAEDYMRDAQVPWSWRFDPESGEGVLSDLGSHIISMARYLLGDIVEVVADLRTVIANRPGGQHIETCDEVRSIVRFANGASGSLEASWVATGRKLHLAFEIYGSRGALLIDMERLNELVLYTTKDPNGRDGYRRILAGPEHSNYGAFCPAPGHQLGFNDLKTIEVKDILISLSTGERFFPDFLEAARVQAVADAFIRSARGRSWTEVAMVE